MPASPFSVCLVSNPYIKMYKKYLFLLFVFTLYCNICKAQAQKVERKVDIEAFVVDSFSQTPVGQIQFIIRDTMQKVVRGGTTVAGPVAVSFGKFTVGGKYTLEIQSPNYKSVSVAICPNPRKYETKVQLPDILMKMQARVDTSMTILHEVEVVASKLKFVWKRDTLIYDATAFDLQEGSMLQDLVRQLPGVELNENGEIKVYGRRIDCLTLNGRDFFKGDNKVMLENLPHFIVKDIKVYERGLADYEQWKMDANEKRKDYVMDVVLKRDYKQGCLANIEAGVGTGIHWLGRAFGSMYSDRTRMGTVLNANNLSDNRDPGRLTGNWETTGQPKNIMTVVRNKWDMNFYGKANRWHDNLRYELEWDKPILESRSENVLALQDNKINTLSGTNGMNKNMKFMLNNYYSSGRPNMDLTTDVAIGHIRENSNDSTETLNNDSFVNRFTNAYYSKGWEQDYQQSLFTGKRMKNGHFLSFRAMGRYKELQNDRYQLYDMILVDQSGEHSYRLQQQRNKEKELQSLLGYNMPFPQARLNLYVSATWNYQGVDKQSPLWRLDRNAAFMNILAELGEHPLLSDVLIDLDNSQYTRGHQHRLTYSAQLTYTDKGEGYITEFILNAPITNMIQKEHIQRGVINTDESRNTIDFLPSLSAEIRRKYSNYVWKFSYTPTITRPSLLELTRYEDSTNPLHILRGNPDLKNAHTHLLSTSYTQRTGSCWYACDTRFSLTMDQVNPSLEYNPQTGGYISTSTNMNGNWLWDNRVETAHPLGRNGYFELSNKIGFLWQNLAFMGAVASSVEPQKIDIRKLKLSYDIGLTYRNSDNFDILPHIGIVLNQASNNQMHSLTAHAKDFVYGLTTHWSIFYGWKLVTDINMIHRRGYSEGMNTNDMMWNAQVQKTWLKGKLQTRLTAYDLLGQVHLNTYSITVNGYQSHWQKGLTRYLLASVFYRVDLKPKRSK